MPLSQETKAQLAARNLPGDPAVRPRLVRWMAQTGWNDSDVADAIMRPDGRSYSRGAVQLYRNGKYPGSENPANTLAMRAALVELMDAHPSAMERRLEGTTYQTESFRRVRRAFFSALNRGWCYAIDGAPGVQKTRALLALAAEVEAEDAGKNGAARRVLYVRCRPRMSRHDLLSEILLASGMPSRRFFIGAMLRKTRHSFMGRRVLLILDEGQHLDNDGLETLRELCDEPPYFGLIFAGSHDLRRKFVQLELEQWRSRLQNIIELAGLTEDEVREIWTAEVGAIGKEALKKLVGHCRVADYRKGGAEYLSARNLFFAIQQARAQE